MTAEQIKELEGKEIRIVYNDMFTEEYTGIIQFNDGQSFALVKPERIGTWNADPEDEGWFLIEHVETAEVLGEPDLEIMKREQVHKMGLEDYIKSVTFSVCFHYFSPDERKMAGLKPEIVEKDIDGRLDFMTVSDHWEHGHSVADAAYRLSQEYKPFVTAQLSAM